MPIFKINFFLVLFWAFLTYFLPVNQKKKNLVFLGIIFLQFTLLAWQRDFYVGQDTYPYYKAFNYYSGLSLIELSDSSWEPGYKLYNYIIAKLGFNFHYYLLITNGFIFYSYITFFYRYSNNVWFSVIIYIAFGYFFGSVHLLRQSMAISFVLYSYRYILEKKFRPFIILILFATMFHYSSILFAFTYLINKIHKIETNLLILIFLISTALVFIFGNFMMSLLLFIALDDNRFSYVDRYFSDESHGSGYAMLLLMTLIMVAGLILKPKYIANKIKNFYLIYYIALCLQPLATIISMFSRATLYWSISVTIVIPLIINQIKDKNVRLLTYSITIIGLILFFLKFSNYYEGKEIWASYRLYNGE